jgi:hypothetical protein
MSTDVSNEWAYSHYSLNELSNEYLLVYSFDVV